MSEENTIMERLFHKLDDKAKTLNKRKWTEFYRKFRVSYGRYLYKPKRTFRTSNASR